jgi:hypothetical protein
MPGVIDIFPLCKEQPGFTGEQALVCSNYERFGFAFDGNAMGQYLGGIDPKNVDDGKPTVGYVNERCCIKYDAYRFVWRGDGGDVFKRPFLVLPSGEEIPIFNLHIHSKDLAKFVGGAGFPLTNG